MKNLAFRAGMLLLFPATACAVEAPHRVLLLHSYHQGYEWTDDITRGVRTTLSNSGRPVDLNIEYLDQRHHAQTPAYQGAFRSYLQIRTADLQPEVIIAADDSMVALLLEAHDQIFPKVPVVVCGVNEYRDSAAWLRRAAEEKPWLAGVLEKLDVEKTAEIALRLHPGTQSIVTIGEAKDVKYDQDLKHSHPSLDVRRLPTQEFTIEEIGKAVSELPPGAIVLLSAFSSDKSDRHFTMAESALYVSSHSHVPVYGVNKNALGYGIVGGVLNDGFFQGLAAGRMALEVLNGTSPRKAGLVSEQGRPEFDSLQLQHWGIPVAALPAGSLLINVQSSFYSRHKRLIWGAIFLFLLQSAIITTLIVNVLRRRRAQEALIKQEAELQLIIDAAPVYLSYVDCDGRYVRMNRRYEEAIQKPVSELIGKPITEAFSAGYYQHVRTYLDRALAGEAVSFETNAQTLAGPRAMSVSYTPDIEPDGRVKGVIVLGHDITERKSVEETLARQASELRRSNADLQQFAYVASHDLQEPLRAVSSFSQMLRRRYRGRLDSDADEFLEFIIGGVQRMQAMIRDLLVFSRVVNKDVGPAALVEMRAVVAAATVNLHASIEETQADVVYENLPCVTGYEASLVQLMQNLIGNAVKYRRPEVKPLIEITGEVAGTEARFRIADNGLGFEPQFSERIFGVFSRLHGPEVPGTGIGLALCRKIVERHGGRISGEGMPGQGAVFTFTLPPANCEDAPNDKENQTH